MNVSDAMVSSVSTIVNNPQPPVPKNDQPAQKPQDSTVVKLSDQARQMSRAESQQGNESSETRTQETAEPAGIQFMEGESKGGRVNTFA